MGEQTPNKHCPRVVNDDDETCYRTKQYHIVVVCAVEYTSRKYLLDKRVIAYEVSIVETGRFSFINFNFEARIKCQMYTMRVATHSLHSIDVFAFAQLC